MWSQWMFVVVAFVTSFFVTSFLFSKLVYFEIFRKRNFSATASVVLGAIVSSAIVLSFSWDEYDFISDISIWSFLAPLIGLAIIFVTCFINRLYVIETAVLVASIIGVFFGNLSITFIPEAPLFVNQICTVIAWTFFSVGMRAIAALYPVLQVQGVTISGGFVLLYVFNASPFILGVISAALLASMCVAYMNYNNQTMGVDVSPIIGYVFGWFGLIFYQEMLFSCFIVLIMSCLLEMIIAALRRLTFLKKYKNFSMNAVLMQVYNSGLASIVIVKSLWMIGGILVVFSVFQANGVNYYSIPAFVAIIILWQFYKLLNWENESKSWQETKEETVENIKETISSVIKEVKKSKKKKTPKDTKKVKK